MENKTRQGVGEEGELEGLGSESLVLWFCSLRYGYRRSITMQFPNCQWTGECDPSLAACRFPAGIMVLINVQVINGLQDRN